MSSIANEWASGPTHSKTELPALPDVAAMIRTGEFVDDIAASFDRVPRTVRDALRRAGWDPDTGYELARSEIDFEEITAVTADATWMRDAFCAQVGSEPFFPEKGDTPRAAKKLCGACTVREECLRWALETDERHGVWGGLSGPQRRRLASASAPNKVA